MKDELREQLAISHHFLFANHHFHFKADTMRREMLLMLLKMCESVDVSEKR
jgi:hypothetical protein